jgi:hypothetical protein
MRRISNLKKLREFNVVLDTQSQTLYIDQPLAEALGWKPEEGHKPVQLTLSGHSPGFFAIAPSGTDSGMPINYYIEFRSDLLE